MSQDKEWRPFEPCLENVRRARRYSGYVFLSESFSQQEALIIATASKWIFDVENPTLIPQEEK